MVSRIDEYFVAFGNIAYVYLKEGKLWLHILTKDGIDVPIFEKPSPHSVDGTAWVAYIPIPGEHNKTLNIPRSCINAAIKRGEDYYHGT